MKIISSLSVIVLFMAACEENAGKTNEDAKNFDTLARVQNQDSLAKPAPPLNMASYAGTLPCADCEGLSVSLELTSDSSYRRKSIYMGRKTGNSEITDTGKYVMKGDTLILDVKNAPGQYVKTDTGLVQLDIKGKRITGKQADKYVLKQTQ